VAAGPASVDVDNVGSNDFREAANPSPFERMVPCGLSIFTVCVVGSITVLNPIPTLLVDGTADAEFALCVEIVVAPAASGAASRFTENPKAAMASRLAPLNAQLLFLGFLCISASYRSFAD
jgi:hypothetical protein